jgi:excisionase family DNA binding protein
VAGGVSALARALVAELDEGALDELARALAPRVAALAGPQTHEGYLAPEAAAAYLGVSRKRIYDLTSSRALVPDGRDGRTPLFTRATLDAYVLTQR